MEMGWSRPKSTLVRANPQYEPNQPVNEAWSTPRNNISSPTPADNEIKAISDHELSASSGVTSVSQNFLTLERGPTGHRMIARKHKTNGTVATAPPNGVGDAPGELTQRLMMQQPAKK